jgi:hypothetical protein
VSGVLKAANRTLYVDAPGSAEEALLVAAAGSMLFSVSEGRSAAAALGQVNDRIPAIKSATMNGFANE